MYSDVLSEYLKFFKRCSEEKSIAEETLADTNDQLQDLYHELEFADLSYHESAKVARKISDVRKERRLAKYIIEQLTPITEWTEKNNRTIKDMEKLLGDVRRAEAHTDPEKLSYFYRTDVVNELFNREIKEGKV